MEGFVGCIRVVVWSGDGVDFGVWRVVVDDGSLFERLVFCDDEIVEISFLF